MTGSNSNRITYLDTLRFLCVTLALCSHVALHYDLDSLTSATGVALKTVTRTSTPALIILFGVMLELVYARKAQDRPVDVVGRMIYRSIWCYVAFVSLFMIAAFINFRGFNSLILGMLLADSETYANIFKIYAVLLVVGIGIVFLRLRFGFAGLLCLLATVWGLDAGFVDASAAWPNPFRHLGGLLFGLGDTFGPSVLHGLTFLVFGMVLANVVFARTTSPLGKPVLGAMIGISAAVLIVESARIGPAGVMVGIVDMAMYRASNAPAYYAFGICSAVILLGLAFALSRIMPDLAARRVNRLGAGTFSYFFLGNALLLIMPRFPIESAFMASLAVLSLSTLFATTTLLWLRWSRSSGLPAAVDGWAQDRICRALEGTTTRVQRRLGIATY